MDTFEAVVVAAVLVVFRVLFDWNQVHSFCVFLLQVGYQCV